MADLVPVAKSSDLRPGEMELLDRPGWGLELNEKTLKRRGIWG